LLLVLVLVLMAVLFWVMLVAMLLLLLQRQELICAPDFIQRQQRIASEQDALLGAQDVTASLRRTKQLMMQNIEQTHGNISVLGEEPGPHEQLPAPQGGLLNHAIGQVESMHHTVVVHSTEDVNQLA
jgi:hypothetical protein